MITATAAEARSHFAKIANTVSMTGEAVTVLKNSRPWVTISPITKESPIKTRDWSKVDMIRIDPEVGHAVLPAEWDDPEDDGLYDDLV